VRVRIGDLVVPSGRAIYLRPTRLTERPVMGDG